jgi:hypothetical protein
MSVRRLATRDYGELGNALMEGPSVPAVASFDIAWTRSADRHRFRDRTNQWRADVVFNTAHAEWSAESRTARYVSNAAETSRSLFAEVGQERNGVFF